MKYEIEIIREYEQYKLWLPATDKADSFDLIAACEIDIGNGYSYVYASYDEKYCKTVYYKDHNNDKGLATMAAVFLCAVAVGEAMADERSL